MRVENPSLRAPHGLTSAVRALDSGETCGNEASEGIDHPNAAARDEVPASTDQLDMEPAPCALAIFVRAHALLPYGPLGSLRVKVVRLSACEFCMSALAMGCHTILSIPSLCVSGRLLSFRFLVFHTLLSLAVSSPLLCSVSHFLQIVGFSFSLSIGFHGRFPTTGGFLQHRVYT